jgi:exodeoxyribonuclease-1
LSYISAPKELTLNPTYLFYDIETTGLNPCFDQVLQFAAIRTDLELNEISRHEYQIKLNPDVIPAPQAMITTYIGWEAMQQGDAEVTAIREIHQLLNQPGTISLGYNTLGFDDVFLRFSFYRNLLPPYTHQFANGCGRMDIYPMTILYHLFKPDVLKWPIRNDKISLKLEDISAANDLMAGQAHNAMVDVEATLELARRLYQEKTMWDYLCGYFHKRTDIERGDQLPIALETDSTLYRDGILIQGKLGIQQSCMAPVISLGQHNHYRNQTLWLRLDDKNLLTTTPETIDTTTWVIHKKMGEQDIVLPPQSRYLKHLSAERQALAQQTRNRLLKDEKLLAAIANYHRNYKYPLIPDVDIDAALYTQPFATPNIEKSCRLFHQAAPNEKYNIAKSKLSDGKQQQALRVLGRHYPEVLTNEDRAAFEKYCHTPANDYRGVARRTINEAKAEAQACLGQNINEKQIQLLEELLTRWA